MLKIFFYHKSEKLNWKNESPIYVRLWHNHNSITITTGKYITKERWEFTNKLRNVLKLEREQILRKAYYLFVHSINSEKISIHISFDSSFLLFGTVSKPWSRLG